jgi:hypothetical protein
MYRSAADYSSACLVGVHSGVRSDAADFQASVDSFSALNEHGMGPLGFIMLVVDEGDHIPPAPFRRQFAELRKRGRPHRLAFISQSAIARGVITAIDWLQPPRADQQVKAWTTVSEGVEWLELEHGAPLSALMALYASARRAGAGARSDSRSMAKPSPDALPKK